MTLFLKSLDLTHWV